jgi:membrane protease YdiL (CAAX protease family)
MSFREVGLYFALAYALSWLAWLPLLIWRERAEQLQFLVFVGSFGPWAAALILTARARGWAGTVAWLRGIFRLRIGVLWWLMGAVILPLGTALLHYGLYLALGGQADLTNSPPWWAFYPSLLVTALLGGGNEEPGWRGYALPALLKRFSPLAASCILGAFWTLWHLPLRFTGVWGEGESMLWMLVYVVPLSVIMTWLTIQSQGSVIPAMLFHGGGNVYSTWLQMDTVVVGSLAIEYNALKALTYGIIALVVIAVSGVRLGYGERAGPSQPAVAERGVAQG